MSQSHKVYVSKKFIAFFFLIPLNNYVFGQLDSAKQIGNSFSKDTLRIETINHKPSKPWYEDFSLTVMISLLSVVAASALSFHSLNKNTKNSIKALDEQLKASNALSERQLKHANETLNLQYKQNLTAKNVQEWINDFRDSMSLTLAYASLIISEVDNQNNMVNNYFGFQENRYKLILLIRPLSPKSVTILDHLKRLDSFVRQTTCSKANEKTKAEMKDLISQLAENSSSLAFDTWQNVIGSANPT